MLRDMPFPFWTSDQIITYTALQVVRKREYHRHAPKLLKQVLENLRRYSEAQSRQDAFRILLDLDAQSLRLSCFDSNWRAFDNAVFELLVLPSRASLKWTYHCLKDIFDTTIRRLVDDGKKQQ